MQLPKGLSKEQKCVVRKCFEQGARFQPTKKGLLIFPPDKTKEPVLIHFTDSDHRALQNCKSRLRRSGFDV